MKSVAPLFRVKQQSQTLCERLQSFKTTSEQVSLLHEHLGGLHLSSTKIQTLHVRIVRRDTDTTSLQLFRTVATQARPGRADLKSSASTASTVCTEIQNEVAASSCIFKQPWRPEYALDWHLSGTVRLSRTFSAALPVWGSGGAECWSQVANLAGS